MNIPKLLQLILMLIVLMLTGTFGYAHIEDWTLFESLYMTVITLSTIGFAEVHPLSQTGKMFTIALIIIGVGNMAYILSSIFQMALEVKLDNLYRRRKMVNQLKKIHNHTILCGYGKMGQQIANELSKKNQEFVVIDSDPNKKELLENSGYLFFIGTASDDNILENAGIYRAKTLVTIVNSDSENVFITLTARAMNKDLHIISRISNETTRPKLVKAGANKIISPYAQASVKISQSIINPAVDDFLEIITDDQTIELQMADVFIGKSNHLVNKKLENTSFKEKGIIIVGISKSDGQIVYAPGKDETIHVGDRLIAIGSGEEFCHHINEMT